MSTRNLTVVLDPRYDMYVVGNDEKWDAPFFAAYRQAAEKLEKATNQSLAEDGENTRVAIEIVRGRYTGPAMQQDDQPDWDDPEPLWQRLHDMVWIESGPEPRFKICEPDAAVVERLAEWAAGEAQK